MGAGEVSGDRHSKLNSVRIPPKVRPSSIMLSARQGANRLRQGTGSHCPSGPVTVTLLRPDKQGMDELRDLLLHPIPAQCSHCILCGELTKEAKPVLNSDDFGFCFQVKPESLNMFLTSTCGFILEGL